MTEAEVNGMFDAYRDAIGLVKGPKGSMMVLHLPDTPEKAARRASNARQRLNLFGTIVDLRNFLEKP